LGHRVRHNGGRAQPPTAWEEHVKSKLSLDLESLAVISFETDANSEEANANATLAGCDPGCNTTRLTCSTKLC
jgi:hypothetical protein